MSDSPFPSSEVRRLANELLKLQNQVAILLTGSAVAGARYSSLDGGTYVIKDASGTVRQVQGKQPDGTVTTVDVNAPKPPIPAVPIITAVPGGFKVTVTGEFANGEARPSDLQLFEVHVDLNPAFDVSDATVDAALVNKGSVTFATADYVPHTVRIVSRNTSGKRSDPSGAITVTPLMLGPNDIAPGGVGTVNLDDGAVTPPKSGTGVTSNLVPDPGFNDAGWRTKRLAPPWGFVDASSVGFTNGDWAAYCGPITNRAVLSCTGSAGVPVTPGESYFIAYDAARSSTGAGLFGLEVWFVDSGGTWVAPGDGGTDPLLVEVRAISGLPTATFDTRDGQIVVPSKAARMHVAMVRDDDTGAGNSVGQLFVDRVEVRSVVTRANSGQRVETSPSGVLVFGVDNAPIGSINADGSISMVAGSFDDSLTYGGTEMSDLLNQRARGEVARVDAGYGQTPQTTTEVVWLEFEFNALKGRAYKLRSGGLIARGTGSQGLRVRYTVDGTRPLVSSPILIYNAVGATQTVALNSDIGALADAGNIDRVRFAVCVRSWDGANAYFDPSDLALGFSAWVEDIGPRQTSSGGIVAGGTTGGSGSGGSTTPTKVTKTFVSTFNCTWSQSWREGNRVRQTGGRMWQGYYPGSDFGDQASLFGFNMTDIRARLAGATIAKLEIYLYAEHWYYATGGNAHIGTAFVTSPPANYPGTATLRSMLHFNKPEGRWCDLGGVGITIGNEIRDGSTGSFLLDPRPYARNLLDYGYFVGAGGGEGSTAPGLRITYTKEV